jgi:addiction module HigA family antidote
MSRATNQFAPDYAPHPGLTLEETIEHLGMTQAEVAERLGIAEPTLNKIINGKAPISQDTSLALEKVTGINAGFWNRAEANYREFLARQKEQESLTRAKSWLKEFPLKAMQEKGFLRRCETPVAQAEEMLRFLRVASPVEWNAQKTLTAGYCRHSRGSESDSNALGVWIQCGINIGRERICAPYDARRFQQALLDIRALTFETQDVFLPKLQEICASCGVAVVYVPSLPKASICGFTRWLTPMKALLQLSDRHKRTDVFWFSFYHEAGHILKHGKKDVFLEFGKQEADEKEQEADDFAKEILIPTADYRKVVADKPYSREKILRWSQEIGVAPAILVGRLRHDKVLPQDHLSDLLTSVDLSKMALSPDASEPPRTLAELLAGRIGGVHGGGRAWSEDTGKAFTKSMEEKYGPSGEPTSP